MIIFILPLIWNVAHGSPFWGGIPIMSVQSVGDEHPADNLFTRSMDFVSDLVMNPMFSKPDTRREQRYRKSESDHETMQSLDSTIEYLQNIRAQLGRKTRVQNNFSPVGNPINLLSQSLLTPGIGSQNSRYHYYPEESEDSPISILTITFEPEPEECDSEKTEDKKTHSSDVFDEEDSDEVFDLLSLFSSMFPDEEHTYTRQNGPKGKVGNPMDLFAQSFLTPIIESQNISASEESGDSPISVITITYAPEPEKNDSEETKDEKTESKDDANKKNSDGANKENSDGANKENSDGANKENNDGTNKEISDGANKENSDAASDPLSILWKKYHSKEYPYEKKNELKEKAAEEDREARYAEKLQELLLQNANEI